MGKDIEFIIDLTCIQLCVQFSFAFSSASAFRSVPRSVQRCVQSYVQYNTSCNYRRELLTHFSVAHMRSRYIISRSVDVAVCANRVGWLGICLYKLWLSDFKPRTSKSGSKNVFVDAAREKFIPCSKIMHATAATATFPTPQKCYFYRRGQVFETMLPILHEKHTKSMLLTQRVKHMFDFCSISAGKQTTKYVSHRVWEA